MSDLSIRFASNSPSLLQLKEAQKVFPQSVVLLKNKAAANSPIEIIPVFSGPWEESRERLKLIAPLTIGAAPLFRIFEVQGNGGPHEALSSEVFLNLLERYSVIEAQQVRAMQQRMGEEA